MLRTQKNRRFLVNWEMLDISGFPEIPNFRGFRKFVKFSRISQIQMLETISVLAIFFILILFGVIFYYDMFKSSTEVEKGENAQLAAIKISQRSSFLPELQCSQENIIVDNCINILNLEALSEIIDENEIYYFDKFSFSRIIVNEIYPNKEEWILYNKPLEEYSNKIVTNVPILLFDPIEDENSFGVMNIEVFSR